MCQLRGSIVEWKNLITDENKHEQQFINSIDCIKQNSFVMLKMAWEKDGEGGGGGGGGGEEKEVAKQ